MSRKSYKVKRSKIKRQIKKSSPSLKPQLFFIKDDNAYISSDKNYNLYKEPQISTFKAVPEKGNKFAIFEVFRKGQKPVRRATIRPIKGQKQTLSDAVKTFKSKKPLIRRTERTKGPRGSGYWSEKTYSNRPYKTNYGKVQLQVLCRIHDRKTNITDTVAGYSGSKPATQTMNGYSKGHYDNDMETDALISAKAAFYNKHHIKNRSYESPYLEVQVLDKRYIRYANSYTSKMPIKSKKRSR